MAAGAGSHSPCGACKFLRRKCAADCIFAPYFCSEQGPARFAAIHKVFGASNVSKLLLHLPVHHRYEAVVTIAYEAQARIRDPVYGCVAHIFALQQQVAYLQAQLMQVKAQIASNNLEANQWQTGMISNPCINNINMRTPVFQNQRCSGGLEAVNNNNNISNNISYMNMNPISPQSSLESIDQQQSNMSAGMSMMMAMHELGAVFHTQAEGIIGKKRPHGDVGELQEMALRMMRDY